MSDLEDWGDPKTTAELDSWQESQSHHEPSEAAMRPWPRYREYGDQP